MPYIIRKKKGKRPYKIIRVEQGHQKTVGSSTSKKNAQASIRARYRAENM